VTRIAYLTPMYFSEESYVGGGERFPSNLAKGVAAAAGPGCEVDLLSYGPKSSRRQVAPGVFLRIMASSGKAPNALDNVSWEMLDAIAECDLLHVHQVFTRGGELGYATAKLFHKPTCASDHGGSSSPLGKQFGGFDLIDRIHCYSDFGAQWFTTHKNVAIIKGGVDAQVFTPPNHRPVRDRVVFVGRLLPHKGVDQLIHALPPGMLLTCCGRAYSEDYFRHLRDLARDKNVEFVTDASDEAIRDLYARAWATVLPSVYTDCYGQTYSQPELMGFTLLESMACGTPAICSRVGGMPEFVAHGETGYIYDDLEQLTGHLRTLAESPVLVERMGFAARRSIEREFDLRVCGRKLWSVYRELIENSAERSRAA